MALDFLLPISFSGGHVGAKKLIHLALAHAVRDPEDDRLLRMVFDEPEEAARNLGLDPADSLTESDKVALRGLGMARFGERFRSEGGQSAVQALVRCLEKLDMPETT